MLNSRLAIFAAAALTLTGCKTMEPVSNITNAPYTASYESARVLTLSDYERAIVRAGAGRGWQMVSAGPGLLRGDITVRGRHSASIEIPFTTDTYSINYISSNGLDYDSGVGTIHPNYNQWIRVLDSDIQKEIQILQAT